MGIGSKFPFAFALDARVKDARRKIAERLEEEESAIRLLYRSQLLYDDTSLKMLLNVHSEVPAEVRVHIPLAHRRNRQAQNPPEVALADK
jgi:hypothetical protein